MSFDEILPQVKLLIYLVFHLCFGELPGSLPCWWSSMAHTNAILTPQATRFAHTQGEMAWPKSQNSWQDTTVYHGEAVHPQ